MDEKALLFNASFVICGTHLSSATCLIGVEKFRVHTFGAVDYRDDCPSDFFYQCFIYDTDRVCLDRTSIIDQESKIDEQKFEDDELF